jgi:D-beta-D-heptose 7-phosphate kinase/D-beta-D-heptose 1-phosphate adenosyltransferase
MKIGLIGDHITDLYIFGSVDRISPESPIPIFSESHRESKDGGAGNVQANMKAFGNTVEYYSSNNSVKTRYVCNSHILFRSDNETYDKNTEVYYKFSEDVQYVVLSDYNKGFLHNSLEIIKNIKAQGKKVIVDPKKNLSEYYGSDIVKLNEKEFKDYNSCHNIRDALEMYDIGTMIVTMADKGIMIASRTGLYQNISTDQHQVSDVTGAGDVFIATLAHYLTQGCDMLDAATRAVKLASRSVTKFGTYVITDEDITAVEKQKHTVFTNGCFDILHKGHIEYLTKSRKLGDRLVVGLNSDASVTRLKGHTRPINNQEDRKYVLENLSCVDQVIIFDEDTPYELIKNVRPDIITKGGDYKTIYDVVGHDLAKVVLIPYVTGYSTTDILEKTNA